MIEVRYGQPTSTVPGKVSLPISAAYSGGLLFTIPVEIDDKPIGGKIVDASTFYLRWRMSCSTCFAHSEA